jgi:hypothetical protein
MAKSGVNEFISNINLKHIQYPGLVKISTGDSSCFFHDILRSFYKTYIEASDPRVRQIYARDFRTALASVLDEYNPITTLKYYDELARGRLKSLASEGMPSYSIVAMQNELLSGGAVDNLYHELVSDHLNRDIYIYNEILNDVDVGFSDLELFI